MKNDLQEYITAGCYYLDDITLLDEDSYFEKIKTDINNVDENKIISNIIPSGSTIVFDYPNDNETEKEEVNKSLAKEANEEMKSTYTKKDILDISEVSNTLIYEHLNYQDINNIYFYDYNTINPNNKIIAPKGVSYIMLVKK